MRNGILALFLCVVFICGSFTAYAAEEGKKSLNDVFDQTVIVPYDFHGKAFLNGQKNDIFEDFQIVQRNNHVLVPIRLMGYLASQADRNNGTWEAVWQSKTPDDVLLKNSNINKNIKFTVNSKTMIVNNQPQTMEVTPQKINGKIVLPLRSAAEALGKNIDWIDGLIIISDENIDLRSPQTLAIKDQIKAELSDTRQRVDYNKTVVPITKNGNDVYYFKNFIKNDTVVQELYKKTAGQKEIQVSLQGKIRLDSAKIIDNELYYISVINNQTELDAFRFADNKSRKIATLGKWKPEDGWLTDIQKIDNELYVNLHSGDLTMGSETLYRIEQGALKSVANAKSFIRYVKSADYMYSMDFSPMNGGADNLSRVNIKTGERTSLGEPGFAYGINRTIDDQSVGYSSTGALFIKDGYLYTLGFQENDPKDKNAVYKISLADGKQTKLTDSATDCWLIHNQIYYTEAGTGYLGKVDLDGTRNQLLVKRKVEQLQDINGSLYYIVKSNVSSDQGVLYRYDTAGSSEVKLSDKSVRSYYAGKAGVYYVSDGYDLGLYKIETDGRNVRMVKDKIDAALLTDAGMVYSLTYKEGIFTVN